ncbi:MAG: Sapep family Mn(2+)-dependent dipeptidase [Bacillota bacterium]|nr:Sapep family Mn(2+)-dependent dipeptidase [Bacillota bacterium]
MSVGPGISQERRRLLSRKMAHLQHDMVRDLSSLCAIPSVRGAPTPTAPYGEETRRALVWFLDLGEKLGFRAVNLDNRAGYVEFGSGDHLVAALCHLDVVPAGDGWLSEPFQLTRDGDRLIARGTSDDKGPAIAVLYAMKDLLDTGYRPKGRIRLIIGIDEEKGSSCMAHYVKVAELPDAGFTPDATFPVIYAEKGLCQLTLTVTGGQSKSDALRLVAAAGGNSPNMIPGRCDVSFVNDNSQTVTRSIIGASGHASMPESGDNAISKAMMEAAELLDKAGCAHPFVTFYHQAVGRSWRGEGLDIASSDESGPLTFNAGRLELDENKAVLTVDIRYPVTGSFEEMIEKIRINAGTLGAQLHLLNHIPPLYLPRDSELVQKLCRVYTDLTGMKSDPVAIGGGTYARTMPNVVAFGGGFPGDPETAHQAGEFLTIDQLLSTSAIYRQALIDLST